MPRRLGLILALCPILLAAQQAEPHADNPGARAAAFLRGRQSPDQRPAAEHLRQAFVQRRSLAYARREGAAAPALGGFSPTGSGTWKEMGPRPLNTSGSNIGGVPVQDYGAISGRVTAIAIDPGDASGNTVYVGAAFGGVWKSSNALSASPTFTPLTDAAVTLSVGAIAVQGSTILVGTGEPNSAFDSYYGQGILASSDGGATWSTISGATGGQSFVGMGFSRILFDPVNTQIVLAGLSALTVSDPQSTATQGIYRSTDGGKTWSFNTGLGQHSVTDMAYDATTKTYYAAVLRVGILKSTDQGQTWTATATPFANGVPANDVVGQTTEFFRAALATRNGTVYALISDGSSVATPTPCTAANAPSCDTGLVQSSNGGATWTALDMPAPNTQEQQTSLYCEPGSCQGFYDMDIAAPPGNSSLVVGGLDIFSVATPPAATAGGTSANWTDIVNAYGNVANSVHSDQHVIAVLNASTWFIGNDGGVWSTANAGGSFQNMNATLGTIQLYGASADAQHQDVWFGGAQDNGTEKLTGPGQRWTRIFLGDGGYTATNAASPLQYFLENTGVDISRFDDAGAGLTNAPTQVVSSSVIADASRFYTPYLVLPGSNSGTMLVGTCRVWEGPDGNTGAPFAGAGGWFPASSDLTTGGSGSATCANNGDFITGLAASASNPDIAWAVTDDGQVQMTANLTKATVSTPATWRNVTGLLPLSSSQPPSSVAIHPTTAGTVYITVQGFAGAAGRGHVFKTTDSGTTWTDITGNLPDAPANWILVDPLAPNNLYVATDVGVFAATDGGVAGEAWTQLGSGLPDTAVLQLAMSPSAWGTRELAAATHGRGLWTIAPLATPDFTLAAAPAAQTVLAGAAASFSVTATGSGGESGSISYACTAPAAGCSVAPTSAALGAAVTVTLAASAVAPGANTVTVSGTDQVRTHTVSATITGSSFTLAPSSAALSVLAGNPATFTVTATGGSGFSGTIALACTAPAAGCTVSPASIAAGGSATVTVAASALVAGNNTVAVTGTSGSATASASSTVTDVALSLAATPATQNVNAGSGATVTITAGGSAGTAGSIALACTSPASGCTVSPASIAAGGTATATIAASALSPGSNTVTVTGSSGSASTSASATVVSQDFALAAATNTATVAKGQTATYNLTLTSSGGFSSPVTLACAGAPAEATCSVSPNPATPTASGATATVSVTTTAASFALPPPSGSTPWRWWLLLLGVAGGLLGLARRRARPLIWAAVLGASLIAVGCGGGGGGGGTVNPPPQSNPGTPSGTSTLTVTGTSGSLTHSVTLTLTVQ